MTPLSPTLNRAWQAFADEPNWLHLHPTDLARFATFVQVAHHPARRTSGIDFEALIRQAQPEMLDEHIEAIALKLDTLYHFGRQVAATSAYEFTSRLVAETRT